MTLNQLQVKALSVAVGAILCLPLAAGAKTNSENLPPRSGSIQGTLWVVDFAQSSNVTFPPPTATPDATFSTNGILYIGQQFPPEKNSAHCYTIGTFLDSCMTPSFNITFSGLPNPNLPGDHAATKFTAMSSENDTWGIIIEFTGSVYLTNGDPIQILHDDGVALKIDGNLIDGFYSGVTSVRLDSVTWTGTTGTHTFDLLYSNAEGGGAWIEFFQYLY